MQIKRRMAVFTSILALAIIAAVVVTVNSGSGGQRVPGGAATDERFAEEQAEFLGTAKIRNGEPTDASPVALPAREISAEEGPLPQILQRAAMPQTFGRIDYIPNKEWEGEKLFGRQNDWEPDIAADPNDPYVYVATTRYGKGNQACLDCPLPALVYRVSDDNGDTWGPVKYLCKCKGAGWQADPQVEVADDGTIYALILQNWHTLLVKSTDHGETFGPPVDVAPALPGIPPKNHWTDHGFLTISPDGQDVFVAFNHADSWVVASHNGGATFGTPAMTSPPSDHGVLYYYHYKGAVTAGGTVNIAATSFTRQPFANNLVRYYDLRSTDNGATWEQVSLDTFEAYPGCVKNRCRPDHLGGQAGIAADSAGNLIATFAGTRTARIGQMIFTSTSVDGGATWTESLRVSPTFADDSASAAARAVNRRRVLASFPQVVGTGTCDFRLWWQDDWKNIDSWNTWETTSVDCGSTWTEQVRISDATNGAGYKHPAGYFADYGDYGGIAVMTDGRTIAAWGEAYSYWGPGGTWINREI